MSEPVKIAEDLQDMYKATKLGTIMFAVGSQIRELIERVSAAEAELALAKEEIADLEAKCPAHEFCLDSDDAIRRRGAIAAEVSALKKENARLRVDLRQGETQEHFQQNNYGFWILTKEGFNALIAARSKAPDGAQEAEGARDE